MAVDIHSIVESCLDGQLSDGADQRCIVTRRGGGSVIAELSPLQGSYFERRLDETSVAELVTEALDPECRAQLNDVYLGMDLEWYRDGDLAWVGPITGIRWGVNEVYIQASDLTAWWGWRTLPTMKLRGREASAAVKDIHRAAMAVDPVPGFSLQVRQSSEIITQDIWAEETRTAADVINELADYAIDYTAYGRTVLVGPSDFLPELPYTLTDNDWITPPEIEARGPFVGFATRIIATGNLEGYHTETAAPGVLSMYGLIERVVDFPHISTKSELRNAARTYLDLYSQPYFINFSSAEPLLSAGSAIPFKALIPGAVIMVQSTVTAKALQMRMRIMSVVNKADGSVAVTLEPAGTTGSVSRNDELVERLNRPAPILVERPKPQPARPPTPVRPNPRSGFYTSVPPLVHQQAFGEVALTLIGGEWYIRPSSIINAAALGALKPKFDQTISTESYENIATFGFAEPNGPGVQRTLTPAGIHAVSRVGTPQASVAGSPQTVSVTGIANINRYGTPIPTGFAINFAVSGIPSPDADLAEIYPHYQTGYTAEYSDYDSGYNYGRYGVPLVGEPVDQTIEPRRLRDRPKFGTPSLVLSPVNTGLPEISGDRRQGSIVTATTGTWSGTEPITYTVQWYRLAGDTVLPASITPSSVVGVPTTATPQAGTFLVTGRASTVAIGKPTLKTGAVSRTATGIASTATFGSPIQQQGGVSRTPASLINTSSFGAPGVSIPNRTTPTFVGATSYDNTANTSLLTYDLAYPTTNGGVQTGDLIYVLATAETDLTSQTPSIPGFTLIDTKSHNSQFRQVHLFSRVASAPLSGTVTMSYPVHENATATMIVVRGYDVGTPADIVATATLNNAGSTNTFPALTTSIQNPLVLRLISTKGTLTHSGVTSRSQGVAGTVIRTFAGTDDDNSVQEVTVTSSVDPQPTFTGYTIAVPGVYV